MDAEQYEATILCFLKNDRFPDWAYPKTINKSLFIQIYNLMIKMEKILWR